jgi:hypothetical protein
VGREKMWGMSEDKQIPPPPPPETMAPAPETTEVLEHGTLRGSAAVTGMAPSGQFVHPTMNLDGPPAPVASADAAPDNE